MASQESGRISATLAQQASEGADAAQIADLVASVWQQIEGALTPIIGQRGIAALYRRSLHLIATAHPWLGRLQEGDPPTVDITALKSAIAQQGGADAAAGGGALLQTFHELLASLVGPSLTGRLLAAAWAFPSSGSPAQDTTP